MKADPVTQGVGVIMYDLTPEQLKPIDAAVTQVKESFGTDKFRPANSDLAGHIEKEYYFGDEGLHRHFENIVYPMCMEHVEKYSNSFNQISTITNDNLPLGLQEVWVNFQSKHEFNPPHIHGGVFSFVLWYDIPYTREQEEQTCPGFVPDKKSGCFQFLVTNQLGSINAVTLPVDRSWNGRLCLFPASMHHQVFPFYSTDEYRITLSGNIALDVKGLK